MDTSKLYRLPWSKSDNPNGWIEVTTHCQLKCPGCYRGLSEDNPLRVHENIDALKKDIDTLISTRNIQTLSIAGGEPLLYPDLNAVVAYAHERHLKTKIFTNGCNLTGERIMKLKAYGVTEFVIHIDRFQERVDMAGKKDTNELREDFCKVFRKIKGVNLGFIMPVSGEDYSELNDVIELCRKNSDVVNLLVFTTYKDMLPTKVNTYTAHDLKKSLTSGISDFLAKKYLSRPCAFLGKIHSKDVPAWVFMIPFIYNNKVVGYIDSDMYKVFQEKYHKRTGKYFITVRGNEVKLRTLLLFTYKKNILSLFVNIMKEKVKLILKGKSSKLRYQVTLIIDGPEKQNGKWNLCDGCPDAMFYHGKLVPSCLLERVKLAENLQIV